MLENLGSGVLDEAGRFLSGQTVHGHGPDAGGPDLLCVGSATRLMALYAAVFVAGGLVMIRRRDIQLREAAAVHTIYRSSDGMHAIRSWCEARLAAWGHPHRTRAVPTTHGPIHVVTAGDGPELVLLPGTNFAAATWLDLIASLASRNTVHAIDLPGQPGLSAPQRPARATVRRGSWLTEVLSALGADRPVVVAHSLGAVVAMQSAAAGLPTRRLVLVDPAGVMRLKVSMDVMRPTMPWLRSPNAATSEALLAMMMADGHRPDRELVEWMSLVGQHVRTSLAPNPLPRRLLRELSHTPVDVIAGEDDAFLPAKRLRRAVHRRLPSARVVVVARAGHMLPHERPDALRDLLLEGPG